MGGGSAHWMSRTRQVRSIGDNAQRGMYTINVHMGVPCKGKEGGEEAFGLEDRSARLPAEWAAQWAQCARQQVTSG